MAQLRDVSSQSLGIPPDLSLGSISSTSFSSPSRTNSPRPTSATTLSTAPSSTALSSASQLKRPIISTDETALSIRKLNNLTFGEGDDTGVLDTPRREKKWSPDEDQTTPHPTRNKSRQSVATSRSATNLTLRDQEKVHTHQLRSGSRLMLIFCLKAHRSIEEGELQYQTQSAFPRRATCRARPRPDRSRPQTEYQP